MDLHLRALAPEDLDAALDADAAAFSNPVSPADREQVAATTDWSRMFGAFDGETLCGTAGAYVMELTVPGLEIVPTSGVTAVGVLPTHRRRGIVTELMRQQLADVVERGEPLAVLTASEATIYRRFGYGVACVSRKVEITRHRAAAAGAERVAGVGPDVALRMLSRDEAVGLAPAWFDAFRRGWPGQLSRPETWWPVVFGEKDTWKGGGEQFVVAADDRDGRPGGYATYRVKDVGESSDRRLEVREVVAADPAVAAALWRYLLEVDLVTSIVAEIGVDDPLRWRLADFRALRVVAEEDMLWARIVDPAGALAARRYEREAELVVEVLDPFWPDAAGRYVVAGGAGGAEAERTTRAADLVLDVADLGSLYLGGVSAAALAVAGRIEERSPGAVEVADGFFGSGSTRPCCTTHF